MNLESTPKRYINICNNVIGTIYRAFYHYNKKHKLLWIHVLINFNTTNDNKNKSIDSIPIFSQKKKIYLHRST